MAKQENNAPKSMVYDEVNASLRRMEIIVNNSSNPIEVFLATQVGSILGNVVQDILSMLSNPSLEDTAKDFYNQMKADKKR